MANSCKIPAIKPDFEKDDRWGSVHRLYVAEAKSSEADVLFIGDSIIQYMKNSSIWTEKFSPLHCLNFGIGGDRVEHVHWRITNGELDFTTPVKGVVLFVGTNNSNCTPKDIFEGICEVVRTIKCKLPHAFLILPTLLPRGQNPNRNRKRNKAVNKLLTKKFTANSRDGADNENVHVVPIHHDIIQADGTISHHIMHDYLHLTNQGYSKVFQPVYEKLCSLLCNDGGN